MNKHAAWVSGGYWLPALAHLPPKLVRPYRGCGGPDSCA
jgi:hypothetical protein